MNLMIMYFLIESAVLCLGPPAKKIFGGRGSRSRSGLALVFLGFGSWNPLVFLDPQTCKFLGITLSFWAQNGAP